MKGVGPWRSLSWTSKATFDPVKRVPISAELTHQLEKLRQSDVGAVQILRGVENDLMAQATQHLLDKSIPYQLIQPTTMIAATQ